MNVFLLILCNEYNEWCDLLYLMSKMCVAEGRTLLSTLSWKNTLKSQMMAYWRCQPFFTPPGLGTCQEQVRIVLYIHVTVYIRATVYIRMCHCIYIYVCAIVYICATVYTCYCIYTYVLLCIYVNMSYTVYASLVVFCTLSYVWYYCTVYLTCVMSAH